MTLCSVVVLVFSMQQYPVRRAPATGPNTPIAGGITDAVATFDGKFKFADKKFVTVEVDEGQTMRMYITGSTRFIRDGKPARAADFEADETVKVDAARDARLNLLAVRVELVRPAKAKQ